MRVSFDLNLALALLALTSCGQEVGSGCEAADSAQRCPIEVTQLLVSDDTPDDPVNGLKLAYGVVAGLNACGDPSDDFACPAGTSCQGAFGLDKLKGCLDASGELPSNARSVPTVGFELQIVFNRPASRVEQFGCDCSETGGVCTPGREFSLGALDCSVCESGRCLDADGDGLPDVVALRPGLATIRCGSFSYATQPLDETYTYGWNPFYSPSAGLGALEPALVLRPAVELPADSDCTVEISGELQSITDGPYVAPDQPLRFHTR